MEDSTISAPHDEVKIEEDHDSPTTQQLAGSLPFSATCIRIARDSYPNLRAMRSVTSMASLSDEGTGYKTVEGDHGYILEDVPHLTDYLPDLPTYTNPLQNHPAYKTVKQYWVNVEDSVPLKTVHGLNTPRGVHFRRAGPRQKIYFDSAEVIPCIVTCGGLCPGLNTVIRELVCGLSHMYNVAKVLGIERGYMGFYSRNTVELTPDSVNDIHKKGGTVISTSRGGHDTIKIVDNIQDKGINQVYIIGGDGTQKGASDIYKEIRRRGLKVAVVGIPKTIDNDIAVIDKSFGFDSAVTEAQRAINAAHVEAESGENGIGLVKLMGRYSGFIAMHATLASRDVDLCLIPESPFYLEGKGGLFEFMEKRLKEEGHMVIVVAEGAGQKLIAQSAQSMDTTDASGNRLLLDVGLWLSHKIKEHFSGKKVPINLKYIDPTYMIRAIPSNASDNVYCTLLAHSAIHGAMAGYTGLCVGQVNGRHTYIPFHRVILKRNRVSITDRMWARLLSSTNQPSFLSAKDVEDSKETGGGMCKPPSYKMMHEIFSPLSSPITPRSPVLFEKPSEKDIQKSPSQDAFKVALQPIIEKTSEKEEEEPPSSKPVVKETVIELKPSEKDLPPPPHDSGSSDTQSERDQKNEEKLKSDDSSSVASASRVKPRGILSFGRSKGWVESQVASLTLSPSRVSTPNGRSGDGKGKDKDKDKKRNYWK